MVAFDFSRINVRSETPKPVDPIEIFQSATIADQNINDLWLAQGDALREWHQHRADSDVAVALNTGAGKTLVGLLIAQSLVNETNRQVIYACSSIQLVEQTAEKARGYGLDVSTYHSRRFSSDAYQRGTAPCVTTYQALFNGKSIFQSHDIAAVIFDDAHTAEHIMRDQFSLRITREGTGSAYQEIIALFSEYHRNTGRASSYQELTRGDKDELFLVHPAEVRRNIAEVRQILLNADLSNNTETMFAWEHIKDHEDLCCLLITRSAVTMTPITVPVSSMAYFADDIRRVYLSATLSAPDAFAKVFGRTPNKIVAPTTTAGECERMILIPKMSGAIDNDVAAAMDIIDKHKALILVPSYQRASEWEQISSPPDRNEVTSRLNEFRDSSDHDKLILTARYDGIDLPGDACRMLVIDDLPVGVGPLEWFQWKELKMESSFRSTLASRIVQSFGRISRGMADHGVVLLTGAELTKWIITPRNLLMLPEFLQKQIKIGENISRGEHSSGVLSTIAESCLSRSAEWLEFYSKHMRQTGASATSTDSSEPVDIALAESAYGERIWNRDYEKAVNGLNDEIFNMVFQVSNHTGAWFTLWLGYAFDLAGDRDAAIAHYRKAHANCRAIPPYYDNQIDSAAQSFPQQILNVAQQMQIVRPTDIRRPKSIETDLVYLSGDGTHRQVEEAVRCLGQYLGLASTRPDNEFRTGPDVLWVDDAGTALCLELKTDKQSTSLYSKKDVGQLANHIQWIQDNTTATTIIPAFVGPSNSASDDASPSPEMRVIALSELQKLGQKLINALHDATSDAMTPTLHRQLLETFRSRNLMWPDVLESLHNARLHG